MAVKLRLRRMGKKKQPFYKIVVADARSPRDGKFIEAIGSYNPLTNPATIDLQDERAIYWLKAGAQPTNTVNNILSKAGILLKLDLEKKGKSEEQVTEEMNKWTLNKQTKLEKSKKETKKSAPEETKEEVKEEQTSTPEVLGATSEEKPAE